MLRIGLTGGIGSGKSTVAQIFEVLGIPVYYADTEAKRLMNDNAELKNSIIKNFGEDAYKDGILNRAYISFIVFNNPAKLDLLNSIVHPATIKDGERWMKKIESSESKKVPYAIHEAALIFEAGVAEGLDHVIGVSAPLPLRLKRTMDRDKVTKEEVLKRMKRQIDEETKMKLCDFVIINDEQQLVITQVLNLHEKFTSR
jgi:dephospho-CoA kinase